MEAPKLPTIFRQNRARGFDYKPMYYDEEKERREELKKKYAGEKTDPKEENFRSHFRSEMNRSRGKQVISSNSRLLFIIGILILLTYLILKF